VHARIFSRSDFVSVENKESKIQLPKLKVAGSSLVARSNGEADSYWKDNQMH
jgi:hypothetical protein